jgi:ABC-2 type transport system ATP-binding protein
MPGSDLHGLELHRLVKTFNGLTAVDEVSLTIEPGDVYGLLGPNGAGKTTILRLIMGILEHDRGELHYQGQPITSKQRRRFGYLPEERGLYQRTRVGETLIYLAQLQGLSHETAASSVDQALERFELKTEGSKRIQMLSKGNQQKVQFIAAIAHGPSVLILDEPFAGLDPLNQVLLKEMLVELQQGGTTILLSTHHMDQAERLCHNITLLNHGRVILEGPLAEIKRSASKQEPRLEDIFIEAVRGSTA